MVAPGVPLRALTWPPATVERVPGPLQAPPAPTEGGAPGAGLALLPPWAPDGAGAPGAGAADLSGAAAADFAGAGPADFAGAAAALAGAGAPDGAGAGAAADGAGATEPASPPVGWLAEGVAVGSLAAGVPVTGVGVPDP